MTKIIVNEPHHKLWLAMRLGLGADAYNDACGSVGHVDENGKILAVAVFTGLEIFPDTGRRLCWAAIAALPGVNWCTRRYVRAILSFPFDVLGVCVLRTMCARANKQARKFNEQLGFKRVGTARRSWDGKQNAIHYDLLPEEAARWLGYEPTEWKEPIEEREASYG